MMKGLNRLKKQNSQKVGEEKEIALEQILLTRFSKDKMVGYLRNFPSEFEKAIEFAISEDTPLNWRAAWVLGAASSKNDIRIVKKSADLVKAIKGKKDGHQRELLKLLDKVDLDEDLEGRLFDICMEIWEEIGKSPSVRYTAFKRLVKVVKKHPELKGEIDFLTQEHFTESLSPGIKNSLNKMWKSI